MKPKPHIQELLDAVCMYNLQYRQAGYSPVKREDAINNLLCELERLGIADAFNWDEELEETPSEKEQRLLEETGDEKYHSLADEGLV